MVAAYEALVFLINVLTRIQHSFPVSFDRSQLQSLLVKVSFLLEFVELYSTSESKETKGLERRITCSARAAEDTIESYIVKQVLAEVVILRDIGHAIFFQDMQRLIHEIDVIRDEVINFQENKCAEDQQLVVNSSSLSSLVSTSSGRNIAVGLEKDVICLMEQLVEDESSQIIIPVVGMGGIGKTTLARNVYEHSYVVNYFVVRSWVTISQDYNVGEIILGLLRSLDVDGNGNDVERLGEQLYKTLISRQYLIVLDDIWSSVAWENIMRFLPDNNKGSRILLTTRLSDVASSISAHCHYQMELLDDDRSWDLLSEKAFGEEACPPELEKLGKEIAKSCKGLPLAIVVIGGLLKMSPKTGEDWELVARNVNSIVNSTDDDHCFKILSLSYTNLPLHLKPCFLYMATFGEDYEICVSELIRLWVSDGFLKPATDRTLEEVAIEYLQDLVGRNLVMVLSEAPEGIIKLPQRMKNERRLFMSRRSRTTESVTKVSIPLPSTARSFVSNFWHSRQSSISCTLLRVLHTLDEYNPAVVLQLVNLRYLEFSVEWQVKSEYFSSISLLWNLETLVVDGISMEHEVILPCGIWELQHLRHLIISEKVILEDPAPASRGLVLKNLQTLAKIEDFGCSTKVLKKMPILNNLEIYYDMNKVSRDVNLSCCFNNLVHCHKLETLVCDFTPKKNDDVDGAGYKCVFNELQTLNFSPGLRKLTLRGSNIPWEHMRIVGSLPNLEILKLQPGAFCGREWISSEGDFQCLKYLSIRGCYLSTWEAECSDFPSLECLVLRNMVLDELPSDIGEIATLESIRLDYCRTSAVVSAKEMLEEQKDMGNESLFIEVCDLDKPELRCLVDDDNPQFRIQFT